MNIDQLQPGRELMDKQLTEREQLDLQRKMIREEFEEEREDKDGQHNSN